MPNLLAIPDDYDPTDANYGSRYELPKFPIPGTYTGAIPTPSSDYAATRGQLPPDYYHLQTDSPQLNQLLQLLLMQRKMRT